MDIKTEHQKLGIAKRREKRNIHRGAEKLLFMPRYSDLLDNLDNDEESERGRALVSTAAGWRTEMARWIGEARAENSDLSARDTTYSVVDDNSESAAATPPLISQSRISRFKSTKLSELFDDAPRRSTRVPDVVIDEEAELMQALAEMEEDDRLDDGTLEGSGDEFEAV